MASKKKPKRRSKTEAAADRLLTAAGKFVDAHGGKALVAGGIQIEQWPGDEFRFRISIQMTGRPPTTKRLGDRSA